MLSDLPNVNTIIFGDTSHMSEDSENIFSNVGSNYEYITLGLPMDNDNGVIIVKDNMLMVGNKTYSTEVEII